MRGSALGRAFWLPATPSVRSNGPLLAEKDTRQRQAEPELLHS